MQGITLAVAVLSSILALVLRPAYALATYIAVLVWYPDYLRISIGTIDVSASRIVVAVLLLRCLCDDKFRSRFVWSRLDTWVVLSMVVYTGMYVLTRPGLMAFENRAGFLMDTWLSYLVARLIITDRAILISFIKFTSIVLVALAILGITEAITGQYFFLALKSFRPWTAGVGSYAVPGRWGFGRANGPFSHSILFGSCFVMFLPLIWALRNQRGYWGKLAYPLSAITVLGALSSMSSGPWGMLMIVVFCLVLEKHKHRTKTLLMWLAVLCILAEVGSNRPLYHVLLNYLNFGKGNWYQRAKLIDAAIEHVDEWWLTGYGNTYYNWGRGLYDTNNEFILKGIRYGGFGIVALCGVLVAAFRGLVRASKETMDKELQSLYWSMGSALTGVIVIWQGVSFFGQMPALFYSILGIVGASFGLPERERLSCTRVLQNSKSYLELS